MSKTFNISPGGNVVIQGQAVTLDGAATGGIANGLKGINVILNGKLPGSWQTGDDFEFNPFVDQVSGPPHSVILNASFVGLPPIPELNATVLGVGAINLRLGEGDVTIDGGNVTSFGGNVVPNFSGLNTLTLLQSAGGELFFGTTSNPLFVPLTNITAQAATAQGSGIDITLDPSQFTNPVTVTFNLNTVGNAGTHQSESDDYVHGASNAFEVAYGAAGGSATATTWNLTLGAGKEFVTLFTHGATTPTTVNVSGGSSTGSFTLFGESFEFANVATVKDTAAGAQIITGALQTDGSSRPDTGFLTDNTALTSITVSSTSAGNFVDMSGFESITGIAISIGGGTIVLDDDVLLGTFGGTKLVLGNPTNIGWGGEDGEGPGSPGTIDWANLPSSANTLTFYHGVESDTTPVSFESCSEASFGFFATTTFSVINTPNTFTMNLQDEDFHGNNFVITALDTTLTTNKLTLDLGSTITHEEVNGVNGSWTINGYGVVNMVFAGDGDVFLANDPATAVLPPEGQGFVVNNNGGGSATINISGALVDNNGNVQELEFGNQLSVTTEDYKLFDSIASQAAMGVTTGDGTIVDTANLFLDLGATDAAVINATTGAGLDMENPGTNIDEIFTVRGSTKVFNDLQGTLGLVKDFTNGNDGIFGTGTLKSDNIFGGSKGDFIWDTAGVTNITLTAPNMDTIFYSQFVLNSDPEDCNFALVITDHDGNFDGNGFTGTRLTTITGFTPGTDTSGGNFGPNGIGNQDTIDFNTDSWGFNFSGYQGLVDGNLDRVWSEGSHYANVFIETQTNGTLNPLNDLVSIHIGGGPGNVYSGAAQVATALSGNTANFNFANGLASGHSIDMLVAFNVTGGIEIADMHMTNNTGGSIFDTRLATITGHDLVKLVGVSLSSIEGASVGSHDAVHFTAA